MTKAMAHIILRLAKQIKQWNIASGHHVVGKSGKFIRGRYRQIPWEIQKKKDQLNVIAHNRYRIKDQGASFLAKGEIYKGKVMPQYKPMSKVLVEKARKVMKNKYAPKNMSRKDMEFWARLEKRKLESIERQKAMSDMIKGRMTGIS